MRLVALALALAACGGEGSSPETVVDAAGSDVTILGASATTLFWRTGPQISAASLASLPATGTAIATTAGAVAHGGEHVVFVRDDGFLARVDGAGTVERIVEAQPDALAANGASPPVVAWAEGASVTWGTNGASMPVTLSRVDRCDHLRITSEHIYVAADSGTGRRLVRITRETGEVTPVSASQTWAPMFPGGGGAPGSTYVGRIAAADDTGVLWLVEEMPSRRAIAVWEPLDGEATVVLEYVMDATGFFASTNALYWQERDALLTAPRDGGAAEIVATLPGAAGALADGHVYFTDGRAIARIAVE